jgi:BNR repeat protein
MVVHRTDQLAWCRASGVHRGAQVEPFLGERPGIGSVLLGVWQQDRLEVGALGIAVAVSEDSGAAWATRQLPEVTRCGGGPYRVASDPQGGVGPDGRMYVSTIAEGPPGQAILVSTSRNSGRSWSAPVVVRTVRGSSVILDKPALLVDDRRPGTAYEVWVEYRRAPHVPLSKLRVDTAFVSTTVDGGRTWSAPVPLYGSNSENQNHVLTELPDGTLVDVFAEAYRLSLPSTPERVRATRSTDGGRRWSPPTTISRFPFSVVRVGRRARTIRATTQDVAASASGGTVYAGWAENGAGRSRIGLARSSNASGSWARLPDPVDGPGAAFLPEVAAAKDGEVAMTWYQTAAGSNSTILEIGLLRPGARRWTVRRLYGPFDLAHATPSPQGHFLGDYEGLVPTRCGFRSLASVVARSGTRVVTVQACD